MTERVVVLGGGACGTSAAHALARAGIEVTVLEREPRVGGLCGTHEHQGFRFDLGGHRFISRNADLHRLVAGLLGDSLLLRTRSSVVLHGHRTYRYPLELDDVLHQVTWKRGARILASYAGGVMRRPSSERDDTFEGWVSRRFGRALYDDFFGPYTEKLWGIPASEISADWASQRISLLSLSDVMLRLLGLRRGVTRTYARRYLYPRFGIGEIFERMSTAMVEAGGRLELGADVTGMEVRAGRVVLVRYRAGDGSDREIACDGVVSTIALPALARMVGRGALPPHVARAAGRLRFRAIRLCNVLLDMPEVSPHTWMYVSEPRYLITRIQEPRQRSPFAAPAGRTSLMLEIPCAVGDAVWGAPDQAIYDRCMDDLQHLGFSGLRGATLGHFSTYVTEGYPVYHLGYREDRRTVLGYVGEVENLVSCGRQGGFRYIFMDTAMEMGFAAARAIASRGAPGRRTIADLGAERGLVEARAITA